MVAKGPVLHSMVGERQIQISRTVFSLLTRQRSSTMDLLRNYAWLVLMNCLVSYDG